MPEPPADPTGPVRKPGDPLQRPRDAATLVLYRRAGGALEVLMGERHARHRFMPNRYVFPGGRVDGADARARPATRLKDPVAKRLARSTSPARARALAMAAVRETFEETGLIVGVPDPEPNRAVPNGWRHFFETGFAPALDRLDYVARAITPPYRPMRFDARFFIADANDADGHLMGSGELINLHWVPIEEARKLPIPRITGLVLGHVAERLDAEGRYRKSRRIPLYRYVHGRHVYDYE